MIELIQRCRSCGTECDHFGSCDACGEGPVEIWAPALNKYLSPKEAESIRRTNAVAEAKRARRESYISWLRPTKQILWSFLQSIADRLRRGYEITKAILFPWGVIALLGGLLVLMFAIIPNRPGGARRPRHLRPYAPTNWGLPPAGKPGFMSVQRVGHTATLLPNGKVLIAGGVDKDQRTHASVEIYDPVTRLFVPHGIMSSPRKMHTATRLLNGQVLLAGGELGETCRAELYDPSKGTFTLTGDLLEPRQAHTATLLSNGKVLLVGGMDDENKSLLTAELYDPVWGRFSNTGSMGVARSGHVAVLLQDGKVFVAGGVDRKDKQNCGLAEVYDPSTGCFLAAKNSLFAAIYPVLSAVCLPDGKVLCVGFITTQLYDPATNFADPSENGAEFYSWHTMTKLNNGRILLAGWDKAQIYDPAKGTFASTGIMSTPRVLHTETLLPDGSVLITGGMTGEGYFSLNGPLDSAEVYDPVKGVFLPAEVLASKEPQKP